MVSGGQISKIEHDAGDGLGSGIGSHMTVTVKNQPGIVGGLLVCQKLSGGFQSSFLDVESEYLPSGADKAAEQQGIVTIPHSGVDTEIAGGDVVFDKMTAPFGNLISVHGYPFRSKTMSAQRENSFDHVSKL